MYTGRGEANAILHRVASVHEGLELSKEGPVGNLLVYHLLQYKRYPSSVTTDWLPPTWHKVSLHVTSRVSVKVAVKV